MTVRRKSTSRRNTNPDTRAPGPPSDGFPGRLDRLIHERMRLGIVSALAASDTLSFNDLKQILGTSDGNLSVHARKLEDAGYIRSIKSFRDRMPHTEFALTDDGRAALQTYLDQMERIIHLARSDS